MKILSIGRLVYDIHIMLDGYPAEGTVSETKEMINCSGGSTSVVAYSLGKWNMESYISGVIGYDEIGNTMKKNMEENKVFTTYLETNYDIKTPTSYVLMNKKNNSRTVINTKLDEFNIKKYEYDTDMDCIIVDGNEYNASAYAINKFRDAISILNANIPQQALLNYFKIVKYVVCSSEVAEAMTGMKIDFNNPVTMSNIYKKIVDKYPHINLLITIEDKGTIYSINNEIKVLASMNSEVVDKTGARDIFVAMIGYGLTNGYNMETTIRLATIAESMSKKTIGSTLSIPILSDVIKYYESKFGALNTENDSNIEANAQTNGTPDAQITPNVVENTVQEQPVVPQPVQPEVNLTQPIQQPAESSINMPVQENNQQSDEQVVSQVFNTNPEASGNNNAPTA